MGRPVKGAVGQCFPERIASRGRNTHGQLRRCGGKGGRFCELEKWPRRKGEKKTACSWGGWKLRKPFFAVLSHRPRKRAPRAGFWGRACPLGAVCTCHP